MRGEEVQTIDRLGLWDGSGFSTVGAESIDHAKVFVLSHGWAPGMRSVVDDLGGDLLAWDEAALSPTSKRYDSWYAPLAAEIERLDPDAAVLAFSWIDQSATPPGNHNAIRSQRRTTVNGQRLAVALRAVLAREADADIHLIGYSHGARVVTIAATMLEHPPRQVTLLDSPDGALSIAGGAFNDLTSYLRLLSSTDPDHPSTVVDNYPSFFGIRYGRHPGLERVIDVGLDPEAHPLDPDAEGPDSAGAAASAYHRYAPDWYLETARRGLDIGFGWSRLLGTGRWPEHADHYQGDDPFSLEMSAREGRDSAAEIVDRARNRIEQPRVLSTEGPDSINAVAWRHRGDLLAVLRINWIEAPDDAVVRVIVSGRERALTVRRWSSGPGHRIAIPVGDVRRGPVRVAIRLESSEPASVEIGRATSIYRFPLPAFAEYRSWLYPAFIGVLAAVSATVALLGAVSARRLVRALRRLLARRP